MSQDAKPFALVVRFTVRPGCEAEFDQLAKSTVMQILRHEPGVMRYLCYEVDGQPRQRVFYEEYESRAAFEEHEAQEHARYFLEASEPLLEATDVYPLTLMAGASGARTRRPAPRADAHLEAATRTAASKTDQTEAASY